ncbi:MAG: hypothetical protein OEL84_00790 [Nitrosopumilus sp.]|nr:hypothetical protein [Nitrosopumilus sp.]
MAKNKSRDTIITVAIIGAIGAIIAGYYQGPLAETQWQERPQVFLSLGSKQLDLPNNVLQKDSIGHYVGIALWNEGQSNGRVVFQAGGINATVSLDEGNTWSSETSRNMIIKSDESKRSVPLYIDPEQNEMTFQVWFNSIDNVNDFPPNQELNVFAPTVLTFEKDNETYKLISKR